MAQPPNKPQPDVEAPTESAPLLDATLDGAANRPRSTSSEEAPPLFANRYEVLGMLGSGGMGTVYRARDRELEEMVALKVLRKELAATPGMLERFRREVKLARRVTHKNVARTFDIGEHGGDRFLTMELIEGEMLGAHLARKGRLPLANVVRIGRDVCAGLAAAHAAGVLHRDLKPENVIIARDGRAVITDFGIARAASEAELGRTGGGLVGTPAYMAPEQVEGSRDLDARTDLYALGVMLFELLSGKVPWTGDSAVAIAAARVLRPPPDVRVHVPTLPSSAGELVLKLMARHRTDRFASAEETEAALAALLDDPKVTPSPTGTSLTPASLAIAKRMPHRRTVAVLPLVNLGASEDVYLADTVTDDLIDLLSVVPELRVRPRGETARYDAIERHVREIGRSLGVDVVVDGSLRRVGDVVRVSVRVVAVEDGFQLWARRFDRAPAEILTVADEAASAVARALEAQRAEQAPAVVEDAIAQELYLRGRHLVRHGWFQVSRDGVAMLREAHGRAPNDTRIAGMYVLALARILAGDPGPDITADDTRQLAERILAVDPNQAEAIVALGMIHLGATEYAVAAPTLKRALELAPNSFDALDVVGRMLVEADRRERGLAVLDAALAIEPEMTAPAVEIARVHGLYGDFERATEILDALPRSQRELTPRLLLLGRFALWRRDPSTADRVAREVDAMTLTRPARVSIESILRVAMTGRMSLEDRSVLEDRLPLSDRFPRKRIAFNAQFRTELKLAGGDVEGALDDLRAADAHGLLDIAWLDRLPLFDGLRDRAELAEVRAHTAERVRIVTDILDPSGR